MANTDEHGNGITWLLKYWPLIVALVSIVAMTATMGLRIERLEAQVDKNETHLESVDTTFTQIQVTLAEIQRDILYIRESVDKD